MDIFLAKQPIFNKYNEIFANELLFRQSHLNRYTGNDGDEATVEVIRNSLINFGLNKIADNKKIFINFTENILKSDILTILSPEVIAIEILENIEPTEEIIEKCRELKKMKYTIVLDDFVFHEKYNKLIEFVDIIKVDFMLTRGAERKNILNRIKSNKIKFLAEKIETIEEFNEAVSYGYSYFQGYYLSKPILIAGKKIPENKIIYMRLLQELSSKKFSMETIEEFIKKDISLSYKLLKIVNSAELGFKHKIKSIKQALAYIGEDKIKKWLYLISIKFIGKDKPEVVIINSLARAKFGELILLRSKYDKEAFQGYLVGMLSLVDVLLEKPIKEVLQEIPIEDEVKVGIIGEVANRYSLLLSLIIAYEKSEIYRVLILVAYFNISIEDLRLSYIEAMEWAYNNYVE